jgi:hypothetical protein
MSAKLQYNRKLEREANVQEWSLVDGEVEAELMCKIRRRGGVRQVGKELRGSGLLGLRIGL